MRRALVAACAYLAACTSTADLTQVMVTIHAEPEVRAQTRDVDVEVRSGDGPVKDWPVRLRQNITPGSKAIAWPLDIGLVPRDGDADRVYLVIATARDKDGEAVAEVRAISGYRQGKTLSLLLLFEDLCIGKADFCNEEQTCRSGDCVDAHVAVGSLLPFDSEGGKGGSGGAGDDGGSGSGGSGNDGGGSGGASGAGGTVGQGCATHGECTDDDPCNGEERCQTEVCVAGEPFACPELDPLEFCRGNTCVNDNGSPTCEAQNVREGETCQDGDSSSTAQASCSLQYQCVSGVCEAQLTETCTSDQCQTTAGCDPTYGCVFTFEPETTLCDDGSSCTLTDHCSGVDGSCLGTPKDCSDAVPCTNDACDSVTGNCTNTADDGNCSRQCQTGTCHATNDCQYVNQQDFLACDDGLGATTPDVCYRGACVGGSQGAPTASCAVAGCGCSGFGAVKGLDYYAGEYVGLIDATQTGGGTCAADTTVSIVYQATAAALTPYSIDGLGGAIREAGAEVAGYYVVSTDHVGTLDVSRHSVDWYGTDIDNALPANLVSYAGLARHHEGSFIGGTNHVWVWGADSTTASTGRLVRCSWNPCSISPCTDPLPTCVTTSTPLTSDLRGVTPYVDPGSGQVLNSSYAGVIGAWNLTSGTTLRRIASDGTDKNYLFSTTEVSYDDGAWSGTEKLSALGRVLVYGRGNENLIVCNDPDLNGDPACTSISGLPNQSSRSYYDAFSGPSGAVFLLASSCTGFCFSYSQYLVVLPSGADPLVGSNWREFFLANYSFTGGRAGGRSVSEVAAGGDSILLLGRDNASDAPYTWSWAPAPP